MPAGAHILLQKGNGPAGLFLFCLFLCEAPKLLFLTAPSMSLVRSPTAKFPEVGHEHKLMKLAVRGLRNYSFLHMAGSISHDTCQDPLAVGITEYESVVGNTQSAGTLI